MPITKSAKKALRQNIKRKVRNLRKKRKIKELKKQVRVLVSQNKKPTVHTQKQAKKILPQLYKALDKAAKTNIIHKNKAAREKSKIAKLL